MARDPSLSQTQKIFFDIWFHMKGSEKASLKGSEEGSEVVPIKNKKLRVSAEKKVLRP